MTDLSLVEVSPRDGLQNEQTVLSTADKVELIRRATETGATRLEVASFVNPARVPQMADAEAVIAALPKGTARHIGLVLNRRGAERALKTDIDELGLVVVASDTFGIRNQAQSADESVAMATDALGLARDAARDAQVTIAVAFGCPFEGPTPLERVVDIARRLRAAGFAEIALADTIGVATPGQVTRTIAAVRAAVGNEAALRVHFHDTRGMGVANVCAAVEAGVTTIDAAIGGTGGCPFAPGAAGNVASEDVAYALGDRLALDLPGLIETACWLGDKLGKTPVSALSKAGPFEASLP